MAGNATIGALKVDLGLNSAQFTAGLKKAQAGIGQFGAIAARSFAMVAAGATLAAGALGVAVKGAIDHADALGKAAQKAGVTVEALSRLEYAAKLSDVSLESLTGGLQKLSKGMADAAGGKGPAAAFKALGIAVTDARGQLRGSDEVMTEIADRFSRLEDGATKTALAMQIFGKSGAEMIPLLNEGADGLKEMADESDRLGSTISTKTAKGAEQFNDTLTTIGAAMQGVANKVMEAALPALQSFADTLASPEFQQAAVQLATWVIQAMDAITQVVVGTTNAIRDLMNLMGGDPVVTTPYTAADMNNATRALTRQLTSRLLKSPKHDGDQTHYYGGMTFTDGKIDVAKPKPLVVPPFSTDAAVASLQPLDLGIDTTTEKVATLADTIGGPLSNAISGFAQAVLSGTNPLKAFADSLGQIGNQLLNAGIQSLVSSIFGGIKIGGPSVAGWGGGSGYMDFDGGGYTGMGARSGGLDGKGGFMAMLHPQESVIDHTRGQGGTSVVRVELGPGLVGSILKQAGEQSVQIVRSQAPAAVATAQRNKTL
jgi:hypothetical protein